MGEIDFTLARDLRFEIEFMPQHGSLGFFGYINPLNRQYMYRVPPIPVEEVDLSDLSSAAIWHPPAFIMTKENCQHMMNSLWNLGIRPSDMGDSVGALGAQEKHLEDMRKIALDYIKYMGALLLEDDSV